MKKRLLSLWMVCALLATLLPVGILSASAENTKTIVCVGDSITAGSHSTDGMTYPYRLAQMLGGGYTVKNQGRSGNCMYGGGSQTNNQYDVTKNNLQADITAADTVIIMLGTNDTKYWTDATLHANYAARYQDVITTFKEWNPHLRFILATPPTSTVTNATAEYSNTLLESITETVKTLYNDQYADDASVAMIDVNAKTKGWNVDHKNWYDDNVHFNNTGYEQLAKVFYEEFWDTTVHTFTVDGVDAADIKVDTLTGTISIAADAAELSGKTATVTTAEKAVVSAFSLNNLPATFTVTAPRDGLTKTYTVNVVDDISDFEKTLIYTAAQLKGLQGQDLTGDYKLMADVDISDENWTPITSLSGIFDGNGHTITMNTMVTADKYGFIQTVNTDGVLQNLTVAGTVNANNKNYMGVLAYANKGLIQDCVNQATVNQAGANAYAAGIVCDNYAVVNRCANTAAITGENNYIAGIAAALKSGAVVANCYNTGAITINQNGAGGIVGDATATGSTIINCYNSGHLTSNLNQENNKGRIVGGILGSGGSNASDGVVVSNCWNTGTLTVPGESGEIGTRMAGTTQINNFTATAVAADAVAALNANLMAGVTWNGTLYDLCSWTQTDGTPAFGDLVLAMIQDETGAYHLRTQEHFDWFAEQVNKQTNVSAVLECDVDVSGKEWKPLCEYATGGYKGTFDGGNHRISGLTIHNTTADRTGLFALIDGGTVKNVQLHDVDITSTKQRVGGIVGEIRCGTISGCLVSGKIEVTFGANACTGGVAGAAGNSNKAPIIIENCANHAEVTLHHTGNESDVMVAGLVGQALANSAAGSMIRNCYNTGTITGDATLSKKVAGITGETYYPVVNCYNTGAITGKADVGGIVGVSYNATAYVMNVYNRGALKGTAGGLVCRVNTSSYLYNGYATGLAGAYNGLQSTQDHVQNLFYSSAATTAKNGTAMPDADMQSANFVRTLNNFVIEHKEDMADYGLSKWAKGEDGYPVLTGELASDTDEVDNTELIETAAQLLALNNKNGSYTLANNITVTADDAAAITTEYLMDSFSGVLNGNGHTITLACNKILFNHMFGSIQDVTISGDIELTDKNKIAPFARYCYGSLESCTFDGSVTANQNVAGLVIHVYDGAVIRDCRTTAATRVTALITNNFSYAGGLISLTSDRGDEGIVIRDCVNEASVTASNDYCGGIVGCVGNTHTVVIDRCVNKGSLNGKNATGGIVAAGEGKATLIVTNCQSQAEISGGNYVGGIVGRTQADLKLYVVNNSSVGAINGTAGGLVQTIRGNVIAYLENNYSYNKQNMVAFNKSADTVTITANNTYAWWNAAGMNASGYQQVLESTLKSAGFVLMLDGYQPSDAVAAVLSDNGITLQTWETVDGATPVLGTDPIGSKGGIQTDDSGALLIGNELQLLYFRDQIAGNAAVSARLIDNVELTRDWVQIATAYKGTFDGDGHTISGFKQIGLANGNVGMFKQLDAAGTINNLTLAGHIDCPSASDFGALVATNNGLVYGCVNQVNIVDQAITRDETDHLTTEGGRERIGGVVGVNNGIIDSCVNEGMVTAFKDFVGGVAGFGNAGSLMVNCANKGEVAHTPGRNGDTGGSGTGGVLGGAPNNATATAYVVNSYNAGSVYDNNTHRGYVGGIIGDRGMAYNCYNTGVVWYKNNGGSTIVGRMTDNAEVDACYGYNASGVTKGSTQMTLADMQTDAFADTLNSNVWNIPDTYNTIVGNTVLSRWALGENDLPHTAGSMIVSVTFYGKYNAVVAAKSAVSAAQLKDLLKNTKAPALGGYQFTNWDTNDDAIPGAYHSERITVTAVYEEKPGETKYTLTGLTDMTAHDGNSEAVTADTRLAFDQRITVTNATENEVAYWVLDGAKVGFGQKTYTFYVSGNNDISVVFDGESEVTPEVVLQQATTATDSEGQHTLTVVAQTSMPEGYTLKECGVYYTGAVSVLKALKDDVTAVDENAYVQVVSSKKAGQQYMTHLLNVTAGRTRYARAYAVIIKDGTEQILWSDTVVQFKTTADGVTVVKGSM